MASLFKLDIQVSEKLRRDLNLVTQQKADEILRAAIKKVLRPGAKFIKQEVSLLKRRRIGPTTQRRDMVSLRSTGATHRSIHFKHAQRFGRHYGDAGVSMDHSEMHMRNTPLYSAAFRARAQPGKNRRQRVDKDRFIGYSNPRRTSGRYAKSGKKIPFTRDYVKSYQKTRLRRKRGTNFQLNIPWKYWHLIDLGVRGHPGYGFTKAARARYGEMGKTAIIRYVQIHLNRALTS